MAKRIIVGVVILLIFCLSGGAFYYYKQNQIDERNYNPNILVDVNKEYVLEIWDLKNPHMYISEETQQFIWNNIVQGFKEVHPNIRLDIKLLEKEEYIEAINKGIKNNNMADVVIDWFSTPFMDLELQIPIGKYLEMNDTVLLKGTLNYVTHGQEIVAYPLVARPEMLIANLEIIEEFEDIIEISMGGWTFDKFYETLTRIKQSKWYPLNVLDHNGRFTSSLLVQGDIFSVTFDDKLNWYGKTLIDTYTTLDSMRDEDLIANNPKWLADFWKGETAILAGVEPWLMTETIKRNKALEEGRIRGAGSKKQIQTFFMPYPHKEENGQKYAMNMISAIPFSQGNYKGEDHTKAVAEFIEYFAPKYSLSIAMIPGLIPAQQELTRQWSEENGLDPFNSRVVQISAMMGWPKSSRFYSDMITEEEALQKVQPILDQYWSGEVDLQKFLENIWEQ